jgi:hypothetical protein
MDTEVSAVSNQCSNLLNNLGNSKRLYYKKHSEHRQIYNYKDLYTKWIHQLSIRDKVIDQIIDAFIQAKMTNDLNFVVEVPVTSENDKLNLVKYKVSGKTGLKLLKYKFTLLVEVRQLLDQNMMLRVGYRIPEINYLEYNQFEFESPKMLEYFMRILAYTLCYNVNAKWNSLLKKFNSVKINLLQAK